MDAVNICRPISLQEDENKTESVHAIVITSERHCERQEAFERPSSLRSGKSQGGTRVEQSAAKGKGARCTFLLPPTEEKVECSWEWHMQQADLKKLKSEDLKGCIQRRQKHERDGDAQLRFMKMHFSAGNFQAALAANEQCVEEYTEAFERSPERLERMMKDLKRWSILIHEARVKELT
jgi:hypothetical protein